MHFSIMIVGEDFDQQLAPFQENNMGDCPDEYMEYYVNGTWYKNKEEAVKDCGEAAETDGYWSNPNSKWDWYVIGGRFQRKFLPKDGVEYNKGSASVFEDPDPNYAAQIRKGDIDFAKMKERFFERKRNLWNKVVEVLGKTPEFVVSSEYDWENKESREEFWNQEDVKKIKELDDFVWASMTDIDLFSGCQNVDEFLAKFDWKDSYRTYGFIRGGEWIDCDWHTDEDYNKAFDKWFDSLPDDVIINIVDCHD